MSTATTQPARPATAKGRALSVAARLQTVVQNMTEEQCVALENTRAFDTLNKVIGLVRAGQILPSMTLGEIAGLFRTMTGQ